MGTFTSRNELARDRAKVAQLNAAFANADLYAEKNIHPPQRPGPSTSARAKKRREDRAKTNARIINEQAAERAANTHGRRLEAKEAVALFRNLPK